MSSKLPMLSAQFAFAMEGERTDRRGSICLQFSSPPGSLVARDVEEVLASVAATNPALCYRPRFSRGEAYQEWVPGWCDFGELGAESDEGADRDVVALIAAFESALGGAPIGARLIRTPERDRLVVALEHALVDQHSLPLVIRQLAAPRDADPDARRRFEAAVHDRVAYESAAADEASVAFWADRLASVDGELPRMRAGAATTVPTVALPKVTVSSGFSGSLFPYLLFSLHRTIRDVLPESGTPVVGYPWGGRDAEVADLVGCFMNTAVSIDTLGLGAGARAADAFRETWFDELDHIDVPLTRLMGLDAGFAGAVTAYLSFSGGWLPVAKVAGTETVQLSPAHAEIPVASTFQAAATLHEDELQPWLIVDEGVLGRAIDDLGERWLHWLGRVLSP